jgi:radical SAM protein with 4Fe4S-binding SPASM domain
MELHWKNSFIITPDKNMQYPNLLRRSIFVIPPDESKKDQGAGTYLLYAPLTGYVMKTDAEYPARLENVIENNQGDEDLFTHLNYLSDTSLYGKHIYRIQHPDEYLRLSILPNYSCNFSCSYCFSAQGRSNKELSMEQLKTTLDYFVDEKRIKEKRLFITFLGGGEPTLSWKLLKFGIEYSHSLAKKQGIHLITEIVTNGSILNEEMLQTFITCQVQFRVSFEILEEIQRKQRGQYNKVCKTIDRLSEASLYIEIRAMITPLNVELMVKMVQELIRRFPGVNCYMFDPVTDKHTYHDIEKTKMFYKKYQELFFDALDLAQQKGKQLKCAPLRNLNSIVKRYCFGELCLTPEGTFTICHRISSPQDTHYHNCIYGEVNKAGRLIFDYDKYQQLINTDTADDHPECNACFVKWNCGGGCMVQNREYDKSIRNIICNFTRNFSKELILRKLGVNNTCNIE